jgi:hypothetical protein
MLHQQLRLLPVFSALEHHFQAIGFDNPDLHLAVEEM